MGEVFFKDKIASTAACSLLTILSSGFGSCNCSFLFIVGCLHFLDLGRESFVALISVESRSQWLQFLLDNPNSSLCRCVGMKVFCQFLEQRRKAGNIKEDTNDEEVSHALWLR